MILKLRQNISIIEIQSLQEKLEFMGLSSRVIHDREYTALIITTGLNEQVKIEKFVSLPEVVEALPLCTQFKLAGTSMKMQKTIIEINGLKVGAGHFTVIAGPCSVESEEQIFNIAKKVKEYGAHILRGGAFKPRTSPYDFQGLGEKGLKFLRNAAKQNNLLCISEVMSTEELPLVEKHVDILQIGARNMQNFSLLKKVGQCNKPVLLKRGLAATYREFLSAAEYILSFGNPNVILCERGIRTFETYSRNTLDLAAVPILKELTHLPIMVDPSHGTGLRSIVPSMAKAALAAGADGIMVEVHTDPDQSISDAKQTISVESFGDIMRSLNKMANALDINI
jgi:3-deoxy-7-phosphoheptulonate synthase